MGAVHSMCTALVDTPWNDPRPKLLLGSVVAVHRKTEPKEILALVEINRLKSLNGGYPGIEGCARKVKLLSRC